MKLAISVTVSGWSGLTNAYTSVLSATGSFEISGASRCEDMVPPSTDRAGEPGSEFAVGDQDLTMADHDCELAGLDVLHVHHERLRGRQIRGGELLWRCWVLLV